MVCWGTTPWRSQLATLSLAFATAACAPEEPSAVSLEVVTWWQDRAERHAFGVVSDLHTSRHPHVSIHERAERDALATRKTLALRLLAGAPPSTFQANAGADLLRWTLVEYAEERGADNLLTDVRPLLQRSGMLTHVPEALLAGLRVGEGNALYAVPINVHRLNVVYYNVARVLELEAETGRSFLSLDTFCPRDGEPVLGGHIAGAFPLVLLAFENVLPALFGAEFYASLWRGEAPQSPEGGDWIEAVRRALECVQGLARTAPPAPNVAMTGWAEAAARVKDQNLAADFTVMGDWLDGTLRDALARGDVARAPFPGTEDIFVFTSDTFPLPHDTFAPRESEALLETIATAEAQLAFSQEKGSIPARRDVDVSLLGDRASETKAAFENDAVSKVPALSGFLPYYFPLNELGSSLLTMVGRDAGADEIEDVLAILVRSYPLLARWQARLSEGVQ